MVWKVAAIVRCVDLLFEKLYPIQLIYRDFEFIANSIKSLSPFNGMHDAVKRLCFF